MTEDEARQKWCPFVRLSAVSIKGGNASPTMNRMATDEEPVLNPPASRCIASDCMAWRWIYAPGNTAEREPIGYCGLAGIP